MRKFIFLVFSLSSISGNATIAKYRCDADIVNRNQEEDGRFMNDAIILDLSEKLQHKPIELYYHKGISQGIGKPFKWDKQTKKISTLEIWYRNSKVYGLYFMIREGVKFPLVEASTDFNASKVSASATTYPYPKEGNIDGVSNLSCTKL